MSAYDRENCPVAFTADIVADHWTILVLREFFLEGRQRFQDLQNTLGASPNTLSNRLKKLEEKGVIQRSFYSQNPPRAEYRLTEKGQSLGPIVSAFRSWGEQQLNSET